LIFFQDEIYFIFLEKVVKTIFCDIDGCLIAQVENYMEHIANKRKFEVLPGTLAKLKEFETKDYRLILTTARKEGSRKITEQMLAELGVFYDQLVMGLGIGPRVVINDLKPGREDIPMAEAINLKRNEGIAKVNI
jgi:hypothetical protein